MIINKEEQAYRLNKSIDILLDKLANCPTADEFKLLNDLEALEAALSYLDGENKNG
jgi:hypothetical protein